MALAVAVGASGMLCLHHFGAVALPGCGAGSPCDQAARTAFGTIPGIGWPVSFVGFAYYAAVACAWLAAGRRIAPGLRWMIRLGAVVSLMYMVAIVVEGKYCKYCIASHALNFALLACLEIGTMMSKRYAAVSSAPAHANRPSRRSGIVSLAAFALAFVGASAWLGVKEHGIAMGAVRENEATAKALQEKIREQAEKDRLAVQQGTGEDTYEFGPKGFTGRWRMGPEQAQVRIVLFGAYTCKFCKQMEEIAAEQVKLHAGKVNLSFKHFPMNADCNPRMKKAENTAEHRNACWASRCAEACAVFAGANAALKGDESWPASNEAFWKAHDWLYDILGDFNDVSLMDGLTKLGFDAKKITELMETEAANKPVVRDVEEGHALGLFQTPMIFINGIEFKGWQVPGALPAIIATTLAANPPASDARRDKPDLGREKAIGDWRQEGIVSFPADAVERSLGKADAPVQVLVFGDSQEENTRKADKIIRAWLAAEARPVRYIYRHFPGDQTCNPKLFKTFFEFGCMTAKAAEAAGTVGGPEGFWKMHEWLMTNPSPMSLDAVKKGARACGLDADAVVSAMSKPEVIAAVKDDVDAGQARNVDQIPKIYINGKFVKTWTREGDNVLERIADEASGKSKTK